MGELATSHAAWLWLVAGILLCACETFAPGVFLLWLGLAAMATGLFAFIMPLSFEWSLIVFGLLAVAMLLTGRRVYGSRVGRDEDRPFLNRRAEALIGHTFRLDQPIEAGLGRVRINDTVWRVAGPDLPLGTMVKVVAVVEGVLLRVEPA